MTKLTISELQGMLSLLGQTIDKFTSFVETGTWRGHTIFEMEPHFNKLHTIEIKEDLYQKCKNSYKGDKIEFILGDSSVKLSEVIKKLNNPTIFWLDGHWSCGDTGRGDKDCPLLEELQVIDKEYSGSGVIIIDDFRLFGKGPTITEFCEADWVDISTDSVLKQFSVNKVIKSFVLGDRYIIYI